jgi:hypothetical protein
MNEDALVKLGLQVLLQDFTEIHTQYPVQPPAQFADAFVTDEAHEPELMWLTLGWLGRMAQVLALLEAYTTEHAGAGGRCPGTRRKTQDPGPAPMVVVAHLEPTTSADPCLGHEGRSGGLAPGLLPGSRGFFHGHCGAP